MGRQAKLPGNAAYKKPTVWAASFSGAALLYCNLFMYICLEASVKGRWQMEFSRAWEGFNPGEWNEKVNVSDFIKRNYTEYTGDSSFLSGATERTKELMEKF